MNIISGKLWCTSGWWHKLWILLVVSYDVQVGGDISYEY